MNENVVAVIDLSRQETVLSPTVDAVQLNLGMLYERMRRLYTISVHKDYVSWITYFEMIVVQLRALCCEKRWKLRNYTIQGLLYRIGASADANEFDRFLDDTIAGAIDSELLSAREVIRRIADKFVCHYECDHRQDANIAMARVREELIQMLLKDDLLGRTVSKIQDVVNKALSNAAEEFRRRLISRLFGSIEEYERIKSIKIPSAANEMS